MSTCPECSAALRLAEPPPAALEATHVKLDCPSCTKTIVAVLGKGDETELRFLSRLETAREARRIVRGKQTADLIGAALTSIGTLATFLFFAFLLYVDPSTAGPHGPNRSGAVLTFISGILCAAFVLACFAIDVWLGARSWMRTLPTVRLVFAATPEGYRA
jgi:hypothetical protein